MPKWRAIARDEEAGLRLALLGEAIEDSLYPAMLSAGLEAVKIKGECLPVRVRASEFVECVHHLVEAGFRGASVADPNKVPAARLSERFYEAKHSLGVADTLSFDGGIFGMNTQVPGFIGPLSNVKPGTALVLGARAVGRAVAMSLLLAGWEVRVWNQGAMKSRAIANAVRGTGQVKLIPDADPARCSLIVNATRLGRRVGEQPPVIWQNSMRGAIAYDVVFRRVKTEFLRSAANRGLRTIDGREMLAEQAALSLEWWTGRRVPREPLRRAVGLRGIPSTSDC
ncbi:MAG: hypothetical protein IH851_12310 [Armatimonadetes bacterium]|nr:hypothetical protein [Armatimonadota bacterium]